MVCMFCSFPSFTRKQPIQWNARFILIALYRVVL